jgi:tetratricopeptide (TPR) repeat protein
MKKIIILIVALIIIAGGVYYYESTKNNYPEITDEVLQMIGGQEVADKLIANFEQSKLELETAISKHRDGGLLEEDKPAVLLFVSLGRDAKYIRKYDLAVQTLNSIFDYYEESDIALINMAHVYEDMGEYQQAIDTYLRFYDMFGVQVQQFHLGIMKNYMALDDKANVIKYYAEFRNEGFDSEEIKQYVTTP